MDGTQIISVLNDFGGVLNVREFI